MAAELESIGFQVTTLLSATASRMEDALAELGDKLQDNDVVVVYFSGHGCRIRGEFGLGLHRCTQS